MRNLVVALAVTLFSTSAYAVCGDGQIDGAEQCDDGNTIAGDGCSATCTVESGFTCSTLAPLPIADGSFESASPGTGSAWEVVSGNVDWVSGSAFGNCMPAGSGAYSIDLNGSQQGVIAQSFTTVAGTRYAVSFLGNANCVSYAGQSCATQCTRVLTVGIADDTSASDVVDCQAAFSKVVYQVEGSPQAKPWRRLRLEFTAKSAKTLVFFSGSDTALAGPMIDDVTIASSDCRPSTCGNGKLEAGEQCDDGNNVTGDGCQSDCGAIEAGWTCATPGQACTPVCGDGLVVGDEQCDDGGIPIAGCTNCRIDSGFTCTGSLTSTGCTLTCAVGYVLSSDFIHCLDSCTVANGGCAAPGETCRHGADGSVTCTARLAVSPPTATVPPLGQQQFTATGGSGTYTWMLLAGSGSGGSVSASGLYTADTTGSVTDTVEVSDSLGASARATVTVPPPLTISPQTVTVVSRQKVTFKVTGGLPPYTWKTSRENLANMCGATEITADGVYTAADTDCGEYTGDTVTVTDSIGSRTSATVNVDRPPRSPNPTHSSGGCSSAGPVSLPFAGLLMLPGLAAVFWLRRRPARR